MGHSLFLLLLRSWTQVCPINHKLPSYVQLLDSLMFAFAAVGFLLIITPGPGVLSAAGVGAAFGWRQGLFYVAGLCVGTNLVSILVFTGLAAIILTDACGAHCFAFRLRRLFGLSRIAYRAVGCKNRIYSDIRTRLCGRYDAAIYQP